MKSIVVFCGSSSGTEKAFKEVAIATGQLLAKEGIRLVYGGGGIGLMGQVADAALEAGGEVVGVIPHFLDTKEVAHDGLTSMIRVDSMHERKMKMHELCDGVITLPGGYGTLEELFEFITWAQLGLHQKPVGLVNTDGFFDSLLQYLDDTMKYGFLNRSNRQMLLQSVSPYELLGMMQSYKAPKVPKWIKSEET